MYDDRYNRRQMRRRYRNSMGGLAVGIFIIGLAVAELQCGAPLRPSGAPGWAT